MACPWFEPVVKMGDEVWFAPPPAPLGDPFRGRCRSAEPPAEPPLDTQRNLCNYGYARGLCPRFPAGDGPDAVRFALAHDDGDRLTVRYAMEHAHEPHSFGELQYAPGGGTAASPPESGLAALAAAYVESYRRRRSG